MAKKSTNNTNPELTEYKKWVRQKLAYLNPIFAAASIGDFSRDIVIPEEEDEFTEFYVAVQIMIQVIRETTDELEAANQSLEEKIAERTRELAEQEEKFRYIIENATNLFYVHDPNHNITYVSPQSREFFGLEPEQTKKKWTTFLTDNPINQEGIKSTEKAIKTGQTQPSYDLELKGKDGPIWVQVNESPVVKAGKTVAIVGSLTDITNVKASREELLDYIDAMQTFNAKLDLKGRLVLVNETAQQVSGLNFKDLIGMDFLSAPWWSFDPDVAKRVKSAFEQAAKGENITYDEQIKLLDSVRWIDFSLVPVKDDNGTVSYVVAEGRDITEHKQAEEKLKQQASELEKFNKLMVGRELKMIELKHDLAVLQKRLGKHAK